MGLRMKDFNILGVHWKIQLLGGSSWKTDKGGGDCLKRGAWTVCKFKGGGTWQERGGGIFKGGWYPNAHYRGRGRKNYWVLVC